MEERQRRSFTDDYKRQAVDLVASSGRSIGSVAKELGHRPDRPAARSHQIDRLPLVVVRKRPTFSSFHWAPLGSASLLQVSTNSEEAQYRR